ncbi:MAG TPA: alpha/beta fold hydrolase [Acetobacteraceae bacterium]|jgi:pimeloyl-ACP methyl ester carboxylesterase|nr:alpha/beta fold hydrolase [Acetobacteraceae bacterium]
MNDRIDQGPAAFLDRLERAAKRTETPCGDGTMVWRSWGDGPVLVLFHGGAGSWRHWAHNIDVLSQAYRLLVPDLPGLGESAFPPDGNDAAQVAVIVAHGIDMILGADARYDVAGFSFGGTMASCVAAIHGARIRSVTIIGSSGVGPSGSAVELMKVRHRTGEERVAAHRTNLNRLMIADPAKIDDLALAIQEWNTRHSRLKTPTLSRSGALQRAIGQIVAPVNGIWGEKDAPANPRAPERVAALRAMRPDADVRMISGAGHWVAYEAPEQFHAILLEMLRRTRP